MAWLDITPTLEYHQSPLGHALDLEPIRQHQDIVRGGDLRVPDQTNDMLDHEGSSFWKICLISISELCFFCSLLFELVIGKRSYQLSEEMTPLWGETNRFLLWEDRCGYSETQCGEEDNG